MDNIYGKISGVSSDCDFFGMDDIGVTVFRTKEEAEQKKEELITALYQFPEE